MVATWSAESPATYVLGAMLPDFASISGARSLDAREPDMSRGVALHHRTDEVFHGAPTFVALMIEARAQFTAAGLPNGASRAAAHIGVELLLDGTLVGDSSLGAAYLDAIAALREEHLTFASPEHAGRFWSFHERVRGYGIPYGYDDPDFVAARIAGALAGRPRLALGTTPVSAVSMVLRAMTPQVAARAEQLFAEVRGGLRGDV